MLEFSVLGPMTLRQEGQVQPVPTVMLRRVLALLLARAGTPTSVDLLIDELWAERPPRSARRTLSAYVSRLRKLLGEHDRVESAPGFYAICPRPGELDVESFHQLTEQAARARTAGDRSGAAAAMRAALALWRGRAFDGQRDTALVERTAEGLEQARLSTFEDYIDFKLDAGATGDIVSQLDAMIGEHPYRERLRGQRMLALYRGGNRADALETFRRTHHVLVQDLGVEPAVKLQQLHQRMLAGDPTLS
ncbi:AfsR/SARP family transcriptional regulator [Actinoplanes sp. NPDC048967]|uniref:AfsR/SARP family transcriptional regulator n=1 Tax=Actinoplanes sp. NPDC048967 TaxID=3155269 RepID=UPI0034074124